MPEIPFALQCSIPENRLLSFKDFIDGQRGMSSHLITNIPEFHYYLQINPNGEKNDGRRGQTWIFLQLKLKNVKKVEADFTVTIESANASYNLHFVYDKTTGWGRRICATDEFFNLDKKYIVNGMFTIKVHGLFKFETEKAPDLINEQKWDGGEFGDEAWKKDDTKDFKIITADGKEIDVHKFVLDVRSEVFTAMLKSNMKEAKENRIVITDFSFNVVEAALKLIYTCNFTSFLSMVELMSLLQFFDKYQLSTLKAKVEPFLIAQISASTVCRLANASILTNAFKLKEECMKFLEASFASKTPLHDIDDLDKDIIAEVVKNSLYQIVEIKE